MSLYKVSKVFLVLFLAFSAGCAKVEKISDPVTSLPSGDVNTTIIMIAPDGWNYYRNNTTIGLSVILQGEDPVLISQNTLHVFERVDDKWVSIDNKIDDEQHGFILYPSDDYSIKSGSLFVQPMFDDRSIPITLRFVVSGNLYPNNIIGKKVSAYLDVTLRP